MKKYIIATTNGELPTLPQDSENVALSMAYCRHSYPGLNWISHEVIIDSGVKVSLSGNHQSLPALQKNFYDRFSESYGYEVYLNGTRYSGVSQ